MNVYGALYDISTKVSYKYMTMTPNMTLDKAGK